MIGGNLTRDERRIITRITSSARIVGECEARGRKDAAAAAAQECNEGMAELEAYLVALRGEDSEAAAPEYRIRATSPATPEGIEVEVSGDLQGFDPTTALIGVFNAGGGEG